jgi:hypothetical protein
MSEKKKAIVSERLPETRPQPDLRRDIEVDDNVAAEDGVHRLFHRPAGQ